MSAFNSPTANTGEWFFVHSTKAEESNRLLMAITAKMSDGSPYASKHEIFSKSMGIFLMNFDDTLNEVHFYHSPQIVGGSLQHPDKILAVLYGFHCEAAPITINQASIKDITFKCPTWVAFQGVVGNAAVLKTLTATASQTS